MTATSSEALLEFDSPRAWKDWLAANHESHGGVWLKIAKNGAPHATPTYGDALDVAIAYGWIDGQKGSIDQHYWHQRFTKRSPRSTWSQINRNRAIRLIELGKMTPAGQREVDRAKQDGRWDNAYEPPSRATIPEDFQRELDRNPNAKAVFERLKGQDRYSFLYRIHDAKRSETRAKRIATFIEMLNAGKTFRS